MVRVKTGGPSKLARHKKVLKAAFRPKRRDA